MFQILGSERGLQHAFEEAGHALFGYQTRLEQVEEREGREFSVQGHDLESLLYKFLEELLFLFSAEFFTVRRVEITEWTEGIGGEDGKKDRFTVMARCFGEEWDAKKHESGTEIKAVTYCNMKIGKQAPFHIYFVVDI